MAVKISMEDVAAQLYAEFCDLDNAMFYVNHRDNHGRSLLHWAVKKKCGNRVKELVQIGCNVNAEDNRGYTPILYADFRKGKIIKYLLNGGARANVCDRRGNSPLYLAIAAHSQENSCLESINLLIQAGIDVNWLNNKGNTALDLAVDSELISIVEILLKNGAKFNQKDNTSVLRRAAEAKNQPLFRLLLNYGANVDYMNTDGTSPLHLIEWLTDYSTIVTVIQYTVDINRLDTRSDSFGITLLHSAAECGNAILVKRLLEGGADVSITTKLRNYTPLHYMMLKRDTDNYEVIQVLLENGANPNVSDDREDTPLTLALWNSDVKIVKLFYSYGADFQMKDNKGNTALHQAIYNSDGEVINFLIDIIGLDVNVTNDNGETALHIVAKYGTCAACKMLLKRGANIWLRDNNENTPLMVYVHTKLIWNEPNDLTSLSLLLIAHIAKLECLSRTIDQDQRRYIESDSEVKQHYENCKLELEMMKKKKINEKLSVFDLFIASSKRMSGLARDQSLFEVLYNLIKKLRDDLPVYFPLVEMKFENQLKLMKAQKLVNDIMGLNDPTHLICEKITSFLDEDDLKKY